MAEPEPHPLEYALVDRAGSAVLVPDTEGLTDGEVRQRAGRASRERISPTARVRRFAWCLTCETPSPCERRRP